MKSVERHRSAGAAQRLKPWQALVALATGVAVAGLPTAAVPRAGAGATGMTRDAGPAAALVVEAVLRVTSGEPQRAASVATS